MQTAKTRALVTINCLQSHRSAMQLLSCARLSSAGALAVGARALRAGGSCAAFRSPGRRITMATQAAVQQQAEAQ